MPPHRALIVGWRGGVGQALVGLLAAHPTGQRLARHLDALLLLDRMPGGTPPAALAAARVLPPQAVGDGEALARLLTEHRIDQVVEVADVDTAALSAVCAERGVDLVTASIHRKDVAPSAALTMVGAQWALPDRRPDVGRVSHLVAAGTNPGIVNALALAAIADLARRTGAPPTVDGVAACGLHVTERDTTAGAGDVGDAFPMSWSPEHALEELLEPCAMYATGGDLRALEHRPPERLYAARCGAGEVAAMVVPHEEVVTLGWRFPAVESAFFYAIPDAAQAALWRHPDRAPADWPLRRLYPPHETRLSGSDRVGALLVSRRHGELWTGFETSVAEGARFATNATLLQTATGVLAGWSLLGMRRGVHLVEELDWREYLAFAESVLGPRQVHLAPAAPDRAVTDRAVTNRAAADRAAADRAAAHRAAADCAAATGRPDAATRRRAAG